ncbi:hypothetical protein Tco_1241839 [Tanacetum coccineum]
METHKPLLKDAYGKDVDKHLYRSMIGSLMYLTSSRPDIMFAVCACARFQVNPKSSHLHVVKRIFRYLKGQPKLGLWYPKDSPFDLVAYTDSDYAGARLDRKSTTGAEYIAASNCYGQSTICIVKNPVFHSKTKHIEIRHHFIRDSYEKKLIQMIKIHTDQNVADLLTKAFDVSRFQYLIATNWNGIGVNAGDSKLILLGINLILLFWDTVKAKTVNEEVQLQALVDKKKVIINKSTIRRDLQLEDAEGEGSANPTDPHHTPTITQPSTSQPQKKQPRRKQRKDSEVSQPSGPTEPMADEIENVESVPTHSNDPLLSGEDSLKLNELMELCTKLQKKVLDLETTKTIQALEIDTLKRRVKKLEKKQRSRTHKLRRLYKVGLSAKVISSDDEASLGDQEDASKQGRKILDIGADEDITLDSTHVDTDPDMFRVHDLHGDEVFVEIEEPVVNAATTTTTTVADEVEMTLAQTLIEIKSEKPKAKGIVMQEPKPEKPLKKKDQVLFDEQEAIRLQAQFDKEARVAREKEEVNVVLVAQWNDIQDKVETDYELAQRLQQEEQEKLTIEEKFKLFQQLLEKMRKFFAAKRAEEKRNIPPTKAQQRSIKYTYLKNMKGWKPKDLKTKSFANVQELFDKAMKMVNTFVDFRTELVEGTEGKIVLREMR